VDTSARNNAISAANGYASRDPLFMDTETTGTGRTAEIVELALVDSQGQVLFNSVIRSVYPIPPDAVRIHGITNEAAAQAPSWNQVWPELSYLLKGRLVGMYNAEFDIRMMQQSHSIHRMQWPAALFESFCVMKLYAEYAGEWDSRHGNFRWHSLEKAARRCRLPLPMLHRALADTELTKSVFDCMASSTPRMF